MSILPFLNRWIQSIYLKNKNNDIKITILLLLIQQVQNYQFQSKDLTMLI